MNKLTLLDAKDLHKKSHFRPYTGKKLEGERNVLDKESRAFPQALLDIPDPPDRLYVIGEIKALSEGLAVIGARNATPYGKSCAHYFAGKAAGRGISIISGGAIGCDSTAHEAAVEVGGVTVAFLGGGCDELYPSSNYRLFQKIIDSGGAVVSEYVWDYPPLRHTFLTRNRLIAGLARATLIVEAGLPSGTFSTADEALAAGKEVLVVPGSINSKTSNGANRLLYQGATPVISKEVFDDILFNLFGALKQDDVPHNEDIGLKMTPIEKNLHNALCAEPMRMDEMVEYVKNQNHKGDPRELLLGLLATLQASGYIARYPDGRYGVSKLGF